VANDGPTNDDDDDGNDGAGVNADDAELPGVNPGDDNDDQPLPDIFEDDAAPPDVPDQELQFDEPNIVEPEPQLIPEQPIPAALVVPAPVQQADVENRRSTRVRRQVQSYIPSMQGNRYQYAAAQIAKGILYPDSHMSVQSNF